MHKPFRRNTVQLSLENLETRFNLSPVLQQNITLPGAGAAWDYTRGPFSASPIIADLDGNGLPEVLATAGDKQLHAYEYNPATQQYVDRRVYSLGGLAAPLQSTPVVVDLPGGRAVFAGASNGYVFGWDAKTGRLLPGWPRTTASSYHPPTAAPGKPEAIYGAIAAGDLNNDGVPEIVVTSFNAEVTAFRADGQVLWQFCDDDTVFSSVVIGDLNRDGRMEVVVGGDSSPSQFYWAGGRINCLSADGKRLWVKRTDQVIWSSPVLADLKGDGTLQVVVGTGAYYRPPNTPDYPGNQVYALDSNGNDLPGWPYVTAPRTSDAFVYSSPAVADLNGDGQMDIVVGDGSGKLHAIRSNGQALWSVQGFVVQNIYSSPIIADINGDGNPDVVMPDGTGHIKAFNGSTGAQLWDYFDALPHFNAAAVAHLKGDNSWQLAVLANGINNQAGKLLAPSNLLIFNLDATTLTPPWAQFRQDATNNAVVRPDAFSTAFVTNVYNGALGRAPTASELAYWVPVTRRAGSLASVAKGILASPPSYQRLVTGWYQAYLGRTPDAGGLENWRSRLASGQTYAWVQANLIASAEAYNLAGGTNQAWVIYAYQKLLARTPQNGEANGWINSLNSGLSSRFQVAQNLLRSREYTERVIQSWYQTYQPGGRATAPADSLAALGWDLRRGRPEEAAIINVLVSNGDYVRTQMEGSWLRAVYADILRRPGSAAEVANWLRYLEAGNSMASLATLIIKSTEYRTLLVNGWYQSLLRRAPAPLELQNGVAYLNSGGSRAALVNSLLQSDEYWRRAGQNTTAFINQVFSDLFGHLPFPDQLAYWTTRATRENIRVILPNFSVGSSEYFQYMIGGQTFNSWYGMLLRRNGWTLPDSSRVIYDGQPFQPQAYVDFLVRGGNPEDVQVNILVSQEYVNIAWNKAFWGGARWLS